MEDFMLGALGNQKVFLLKLCAGVQNLGVVKESHGRDTTWPLCIKHFIHMSAQVKLPVKKKIHWKGFIKLLSLHSIQMYNWLRNLTLEDVFLLNYSCKDTTFWDALWVACQDDSMHQLGLRCLPSIRMPPPVLLPHLCHPPCPSANARRGGTLMLQSPKSLLMRRMGV